MSSDLPLNALKILVIDDSEDNQVMIQRKLERSGATVVIADNGAKGVEVALAGHFDLVLMDIQMPLMDGYMAMAELKAAKYPRPIIALTAHALAEEREKTRAAGFFAHVTKPIEFPKLIAAILEGIKSST